MQQHLVIWGDIGTDRKALIAIEFNADSHKVIYRAFPEEVVDQELQHNLFTIWKNGGAFEFPADIPVWEIDANLDHILPEEINLHKPGMLVNAKKQWNKSLLLTDNFKLFSEKLHLIELELEGTNTFEQKLWTRTKALWDDILKKKKEQELAWTQADELKLRINSIFDGLKALRRLNHEKSFEESHVLTKAFNKQIEDCKARLIYPDEWNKIFNRLKEIQKDMKDAPILHKHRRQLFKALDQVFGELRSYKKANHVQHIDGRINDLKRVLRGLVQSIDRDEESYKNQFEKMKHYTRGKMSDAEIENQLKYMKDRRKAKEKKIRSIEKTIRSLENKKEKIENEPASEPKKRAKRKKRKKKSAPESAGPANKASDSGTGKQAADPVKKEKAKKENAGKPKPVEPQKEDAPALAETTAAKATEKPKEIAKPKEAAKQKEEKTEAEKPDKSKSVKPQEDGTPPLAKANPAKAEKKSKEEVKQKEDKAKEEKPDKSKSVESKKGDNLPDSETTPAKNTANPKEPVKPKEAAKQKDEPSSTQVKKADKVDSEPADDKVKGVAKVDVADQEEKPKDSQPPDEPVTDTPTDGDQSAANSEPGDSDDSESAGNDDKAQA